MTVLSLGTLETIGCRLESPPAKDMIPVMLEPYIPVVVSFTKCTHDTTGILEYWNTGIKTNSPVDFSCFTGKAAQNVSYIYLCDSCLHGITELPFTCSVPKTILITLVRIAHVRLAGL